MNSVIRSFLKVNIFFGLLLILFILIGLWVYDVSSGDANGIVAGININPIIKITASLAGLYLLLLAFIKKNKTAQNAVLSIISIAITFFILEWFSGKWLAFQQMNKLVVEGPKHSFIPDENLGYKPAPNETIRGLKTIDGKPIYDITFQTDKNSLRKVNDANEHVNKFAQFYGCSMTFGEGVNSDETIPYLLTKLDSSYHAYNFAFSGYGPTQMLARLQTNQLDSFVLEKEGFGIYIYIPDHVNRVINTYTNYSYNRGNVPKYELKNNELKRNGTYATTSKLRNRIFEGMAKSNILRLFNVGYPFKISEADYDLTAEVLAESAKEFKHKFQSDRFFVVIYPSNADNNSMVSLLRNKGLNVLDYSKLFDPASEGMAIPNDEHPTSKANQILVNQLYKDISATD